jgi:colanic acid/amylovoran/stewartan biosynthesis glycosyltransferase WcaL/AmsK/CpsK
MSGPPVSFFLPRFPAPSETFIQAQAEGLIERGVDPLQIMSLGYGGAAEIAALAARWGKRLDMRFAPVPKTLGVRILQTPWALTQAHALEALNVSKFGDDAASLRLAIAVARWPDRGPPSRRIWLAHYGRWGRFACALRELGLIAGPIATVFHGKDMSAYLDKRNNDAYRHLFARGDLFLPISEFWKEKLIRLGADPGRIMVHRMGVDTRRFTEIPRTLQAGEPVKFIGVGRMVEKKGFDDALAAFDIMCSKPNPPDATLTLIGDGPLRAKMMRKAERRGLSDRVKFTGLLPHGEVEKAIKQAHVFVLASKTSKSGDMEGIPVALMEAMGAGMAVIATRHSGTPELVEHEVSGLLCEEGDRQGLAANMERLARMPERWAAMGAAGSAKVRADFDLNYWNDQLLDRLTALGASTTPPLNASTPS